MAADVLDIRLVFRVHAYTRIAHGREFLEELLFRLFVVICDDALVICGQTHKLAFFLST